MNTKPYLEIWKDIMYKFRLSLKGGNHEIIFTTEGYERKASAEYASRMILSLSPDTKIYDRTTERSVASALKSLLGNQTH